MEDFSLSKAATAPITIFNAVCEKAEDYTKKKNVFRLKCTDGSEFLFLAPSQQEMEDWVNKISFHAKLPPSLQLLSYDESQKVCDKKINLYFYTMNFWNIIFIIIISLFSTSFLHFLFYLFLLFIIL